MKSKRGHGKPGTKEETKKVIELYEKGYTTREIAKMIDRSYCFVYTRIDKYRINKCRGLI